MNDIHSVLIIAVVAVVTAIIRFSPFIIFKKRVPETVEYLSKVLPYAVIGMLVVYCLKDTDFKSYTGFVPQIAGVAITVIVHKIKHSTLLSIVSGTACYMVLIRIL